MGTSRSAPRRSPVGLGIVGTFVPGRKEFFYFRLYPFKTSLIPAELETKRNFIEQMNREIDSLVLAWRHKVDHAANHLAIIRNAEFTPDVAKHIIGAVCVFTLRLVDVRVIRIIRAADHQTARQVFRHCNIPRRGVFGAKYRKTRFSHSQQKRWCLVLKSSVIRSKSNLGTEA